MFRLTSTLFFVGPTISTNEPCQREVVLHINIHQLHTDIKIKNEIINLENVHFVGLYSIIKTSTYYSFIDTYLIHNFFLYKLHKIKFLCMFRASSAHLQEVNDVNCTCMQPLVFSYQRIPEAAYMYN